MVLAAFKGAVGFLTRIPVGHDEESWNAFRSTSVTLPLTGYIIGAIVAFPLLLPLPDPTLVLLFVLSIYGITGINHIDGIADLGDAVVIHGDATERLAVMKDTKIGVGAVVGIVSVVIGIGLAAVVLTSLPTRGLFIVISAEVGAKLGMVVTACFGTATHDGMGSEFSGRMRPRSVLLPLVASIPAGLSTFPHPAASMVLLASVLSGVTLLWWANRNLGGINGDVIGATNEIARVVGLHTGVVAWMVF